MKINLETIEDLEQRRVVSDLLEVYYSDTFINIKGYLQKLIDLLYHMGYYKDNESLFLGDNT